MSNILEIKNFTLGYGKSNLLENTSLSIDGGTINLITGSNGTGKSSVVKALLRDVSFTGNFNVKEINYLGKQVKNFNKFRGSVAYVSQSYNEEDAICKKAYDEIVYAAKMSKQYKNIKEMHEYIDNLLNIFDKKAELRNGEISRLSGGKKALLNILTGLVKKDSKLYIFDEPINNLDSSTAVVLCNYLLKMISDNKDKGVLIISHCRIFPKIDNAYTISDKKLLKINYCYQSCFGIADPEGYYSV